MNKPFSTTPSSALTADLLDRVEAPAEAARGFPNAAYTDEAFLALERQQVFARNWVLAGFAHQIPNPGDAMPADVAGLPVVLWRGKDGAINGFHNACRHRGAMLVDRPCAGRNRLVCPYHAWTYDQSGRLAARPYFDGKHPREQQMPADPGFDLQPVRLGQWQDLIFADLSGEAPPLDDVLRPMTDAIADYNLSQCRHAGMAEFEIATNWKLAAENFIESYHVFAAHPALVNFAPMDTRRPGGWTGKCFSTHYQFPKAEEGRGEGLPHYPNMPEHLKTRGIWFLLYPNLGIELWPDQFVVFRIMPLAAARTREEIHVYLMGEAADAPAYRGERERVMKLWRDLNGEDIGLLEVLQKGRASPSYDGGVFSPAWEQPVLQFSQLLARDLTT